MDSSKTVLESRGRPAAYNEEQQKLTMKYLKRSYIPLTCPGRKDQVYMDKDESGEKYHPKHYFLWFLTKIKIMMNNINETELPDNQQFTTLNTGTRTSAPMSIVKILSYC